MYVLFTRDSLLNRSFLILQGTEGERDIECQPSPSLSCWQHKKAYLKTFNAMFSLLCGDFCWDWHSISPSACDNTLYFHAPNSIFSTYCNSLDGKQNHNVVSQSNGITSDHCHELLLKSYILNYIRYTPGSHSSPCKVTVVCHVSYHTTSKKYSLYLFWAVLATYSLCAHSPSMPVDSTRNDFGLWMPQVSSLSRPQGFI